LEKRFQAAKNALYNLEEESFLNNGEYDKVKAELQQIMDSCKSLLENGPRATRNKKSEEDPS
jgi:hypothetical protein